MQRIRTLSAAAALLIAGAAQADLARVGPNSPAAPAVPTTTSGNGFPLWYQDSPGGMVLDLCLPDANDRGTFAALNQGNDAQALACFVPFNPPPGGYVFGVGTFPDEMFYFNGGALMTVPGGAKARLVLALEGAFGTGAVQAGQQMVFARVRIAAGVPFPGTYTVTHPYGTAGPFEVESVGTNRDIFDTVDVGLVPLNFAEALKGAIGPFLEHVPGASDAVTGVPFPLDASGKVRFTVNGATMLGDGSNLGAVMGSPFGTNYFEMCGPYQGYDAAGAVILDPATGKPPCVRTDDLTVIGRLHNGLVGSPLTVTRATFSRDSTQTTIDVGANIKRGLGQPNAPVLSVAGPDLVPVKMFGPNSDGDWYAKAIPVSNTLAAVTISNSADVPPSSIGPITLSDVVTITSANYTQSASPLLGTLTVDATSSDKLGTPTLALFGFNNCSGTMTTNCAVVTKQGADFTFTVTGLNVAPGTVKVISALQASNERTVDFTVNPATLSTGAPFAGDASRTVDAGSATGVSINIPALGLVKLAGGQSILSWTVTAPTSGTLTGANGVYVFKSSTPTLAGEPTTFTYRVSTSAGTSNAGTISVDVTPSTSVKPIAVADSATLPANSNPIQIKVLLNDQLPPNASWPTNPVTITTAPVGGTAVANADGSVTYTPPSTGTGTVTFQYTATANLVASDPATVTITVTTAESLAVNTAKCAISTRSWELRGTSSQLSGTVNLYNAGTSTAIQGKLPNGSGQTIPGGDLIAGNVPIVAGAWQFKGTSVASCTTSARVKSGLGTQFNNLIVTAR